MTMPTSSRRSFMSTAIVAAAASVSGGTMTAPAAAAICRAAPYVPAIEAQRLAAAGEAAVAAPICPTQASAAYDQALDLAARFRREHVRFHALPDDCSEEDDNVAYDAWANAAAACYATPPSTPAGALAFVSVMVDREDGLIDENVLAALVVLRDGLAAMVQS